MPAAALIAFPVFRSGDVFQSPVRNRMKDREQIFSLVGKRVFDMRRDLVKLFSVDQFVFFQFPQGICERCVCYISQHLFEFPEAHGGFDTEFIDDLHLPFSLQHGYDRSDGAVPVFRQDDTVHQFTEFFER